MNGIMVVAEQNGGKIAKVSFELLGKARELDQALHCGVSAVIIGEGITAQAKELIECGADTVYVFDGEVFKHYRTDVYAQAAERAIKKEQPQIVLFGATSIGRDLAPRLSARLKTGLTADCTRLEIGEDGKLYMTRPAFGGNLFATILCPDHLPQMSTVRPGVMVRLKPDKKRKGEIIVESVTGITPDQNIKVIMQQNAETKEQSIEEVRVLFSIGRGAVKECAIKSAENAARLIGGAVSSSRAVVDKGILPAFRQVGQTGKTVRPSVYVALGISGAVQHLAGMDQSDYIIAVNTDPAAPIFSIANLGIVGDACKIMPLLEKKLINHKKST